MSAEDVDAVGGLAHDLANVLVGVVGNLEMADQSIGVSSIAHEHLARARTATFLAAALARQLVDASSGTTTNILDLNGACEDMCQLVDVSTPPSTRIVVFAHSEPLHVEAPPRALRRIVLNLVKNATEALPNHKGQVVVSTDLLDGGQAVELQVRDDGRGIAPGLITRVFEREVSTKPTCGGTGLAAVGELVEQIGGTIVIASRLGRGTVVTVVLPTPTAT